MSVLKENVDPLKCSVQLGTEICANVIATMGVTSYRERLSVCLPSWDPFLRVTQPQHHPERLSRILRLFSCPSYLLDFARDK